MQTKIIITTILTISMKKKTYASLFVAFALSLTVQAQEWKAPQVPSEDLSSLKSTTTVYLYNVEADAFVTNGMDWNTNACATRTKVSEPHRAYAFVSGRTVSVRLQSFAEKYISCPSANAYDIYVDQTSNYSFRFAETESGSNVYTLINVAHSKALDVVWQRGGHLTLVGGAGQTHWAFIAETTVTNGAYARYKWQKRLYSIYTFDTDTIHTYGYFTFLGIKVSTTMYLSSCYLSFSHNYIIAFHKTNWHTNSIIHDYIHLVIVVIPNDDFSYLT